MNKAYPIQSMIDETDHRDSSVTSDETQAIMTSNGTDTIASHRNTQATAAPSLPSSAGTGSGYDGSASDEGSSNTHSSGNSSPVSEPSSSALPSFGSSYQSIGSSTFTGSSLVEQNQNKQSSFRRQSCSLNQKLTDLSMDSITSERTSPSLSSNSNNSSDKVKPSCAIWQGSIQVLRQTGPIPSAQCQTTYQTHSLIKKDPCAVDMLKYSDDENLIYSFTHEMMIHILTYLGPPHVIHKILIYPFSKAWRANYTKNSDLWRALCISEPFGAMLGHRIRRHSHDRHRQQTDVAISSKKRSYENSPLSTNSSESSSSSSDNDSSNISENTRTVRQIYGRYRLMHASFVRCLKYLEKIRVDASRVTKNSEGSSTIAGNVEDVMNHYRAYQQQHQERLSHNQTEVSRKVEDESSQANTFVSNKALLSPSQIDTSHQSNKKAKVAPSNLTAALFGPRPRRNTNSKSRKNAMSIGPIDLPWTCAIYSVLNWMVAFHEVRGIQVACLKVLPVLLEDEGQRTIGQKSGLTEMILRGMLLFPDCVELHVAALHSIVLLARPLGGREGQPYDNRAMNYSGIFCGGYYNHETYLTQPNKSPSPGMGGMQGIAVVLDSMRRFRKNESIQAMGCWSMVNIALIPRQKTMLLKLGGTSVALNAMANHPRSAEVQFRAIFALINLVVISELFPQSEGQSTTLPSRLEVDTSFDCGMTEKELIDESAPEIVNSVVVAMKNFCASGPILNRACLVLHNLSLFDEYLPILIGTPNCYQMLEWCLANFLNDNTLQQSANRTLQRLQNLLANDDSLRERFSASLRNQRRVIHQLHPQIH